MNLHLSRSRAAIARLLLVLAASLLFSMPTSADPGHGNETAASTAGSTLPRFSATSDLFELVGVLNGKQLTVYLDHATTNAPVKDSTVELEFAGTKLKLEAHGEGEFLAALPETPKAGVIAITATVLAGSDTDLLVGELDLRDNKAITTAQAHGSWSRYLPWAGGLIAAIALTIWTIKRRRNRRPGVLA